MANRARIQREKVPQVVVVLKKVKLILENNSTILVLKKNQGTNLSLVL